MRVSIAVRTYLLEQRLDDRVFLSDLGQQVFALTVYNEVEMCQHLIPRDMIALEKKKETYFGALLGFLPSTTHRCPPCLHRLQTFSFFGKSHFIYARQTRTWVSSLCHSST